MTEFLQFDESLFHLVNSGCHNAFFDWLMPLLRNKYIWVPLYVFLASFLLLNFGQKGLIALLALVLTIAITDNVSSQLIKKTVQRLRPCKVLEPNQDFHLLIPCGSGYSFPSTHAANHFALASFLLLVLGRLFRWIRIPLLLWAVAISFAQVYVGVHYPFDVLAGGILGVLVGWGMYFLWAKLPPNLLLHP